MNLDSLRLAALSSKRQRKPQEVEEGEIDSDATTAPTRTTHDSPRVSPQPPTFGEPTAPPRHPSPAQPQFATSPPRIQRFSPPTAAPTQVLAIKEESKGIIAQLISYGVTPDYLLSVGVSRDIIDISFHELGLAPPSFAAVAPAVNPNFRRGAAPPTPYEEHHYGPSDETYGVRTTSPPPANPLPPPPPLNPELALIEARKREELFALVEARKREELLARMAANAARNKQKAMSLESELDSLFASAPSAPTVKTESSEEEQEAQDEDEEMMDIEIVQQGAVEVNSDADLGALRDSLAHTEETVNTPAAGPFGVEPEQPRPLGRRPLAVDFEAEPTISLPPTASRSYVSDMPVKMVIDLSESEGEDEEDEEGQPRGGVKNGSNVASTQDVAMSSAAAQATTTAEGADTEAKRKLEEKELEIKRIMDRIAKMEKKKGRSAPSRQSSVPAPSAIASAPTTATSTPRPSPPPVAPALELEEAREHVQVLEAERTSLVAALQEGEEMLSVEPVAEVEATTPAPQDTATNSSPPVEATEVEHSQTSSRPFLPSSSSS